MLRRPIFLAFLACILFYFACNKSDLDLRPTPPLEPPINSSFTYLALGDSYTIGQGVSEQDRWPIQLKDSLASQGIEIRDLRIIAQTGWTTRNLLEAVESAQPDRYDLVSLLIGVNNQYQQKPFEQFKTELDALLIIARQLSIDPDKVFVVSIPDYGETPFGANNSAAIAEQLDEYNAYTETVCDSLEIPYVNITDISRMLGAAENALAPDNLHPSGYQYSKWVEKIFPVVKTILSE